MTSGEHRGAGERDEHDGLGVPMRSDSTPPIGRATTAAMAKPAVRVPAPVRSKS